VRARNFSGDISSDEDDEDVEDEEEEESDGLLGSDSEEEEEEVRTFPACSYLPPLALCAVHLHVCSSCAVATCQVPVKGKGGKKGKAPAPTPVKPGMRRVRHDAAGPHPVLPLAWVPPDVHGPFGHTTLPLITLSWGSGCA
jgi:hypothetical protein